ncbi:MAG TPA: integrase family protein, partial [Dongiaceae bacterium]|nr:integrase family protein [Dongiaceae bacterium]
MSNKISITDRTLAALSSPPPGSKDALYFDSALRGFAVRVTRAGNRVLLFSYNIAGRTRREPIGTWGQALTASAARKEAERLAARVRLGGDPVGERKARLGQRESQRAEDRFTVAVLIDSWESAMTHRRSAGEAVRRVQRSFPAWLGRPASSITRREAIQAIDRIATESGIIAARRAAAYARAMYAWAVRRDALPANPFTSIALPGQENPRERVLDAHELGAIWRAASALDPVRSAFVRLLLASLQRRSEVAGLRWEELTADRTLWQLPGSRTKNGKAHIVHLPPVVREILDSIPRLSGSLLVLTTYGRALGGFDAIKKKLDAAILAER